MKNLNCFALIVSVFFISTLTFAETEYDTNREITRTYAKFYLQQKDIDRATLSLADHLQGDLKDGGAWNYLGLVYLEKNDLRRARDVFAKAVDQGESYSDSDLGIYLYNQADAYIRSGNVNRAKKSLLLSMKHSNTESAAERALESLRKGVPLPAIDSAYLEKVRREKEESGPSTNFVIGTLSTGVGYDSNVLLSSDSTLGASSNTKTASPFAAATGQLGYLSLGETKTFEALATSSFTFHSDSAAKTFNSLYSSALLGYKFHGTKDEDRSGFKQGLNNRFDLSYLNNNSFAFYNWANTLSWSGSIDWHRHLQTTFSVSGIYKKFAVDSGDDPDDDRTGFAMRPAVYQYWVAGPNTFRVGFYYERDIAEGANYKSHAFSAPLSWSRKIFWKINMSWDAAVSRISYPNSSDTRKDTAFTVTPSFYRRIAGPFLIGLDYSFKRNTSSSSDFQYTKHAVGTTVSYVF